MRKRRKFYCGAVNHVYQRTVDGIQLFYCDIDCLVFFTILAVCSRSSGIHILEICLMHNHIHLLIQAEIMHELSHFMDHCTAWFVREYNSFIGRSGKLFKKNYGSAPKWDEKKLRSAIIYIGNNPVEKHFCKNAEEFRWNFLSYGLSDNPFSEPLIKRKASQDLRKAIKEVDLMSSLNLPLKYAQLMRMTKKLSEKEYEQFIDYVINTYSPIDYKKLASHFKSYESMLHAMSSTAGNDFDIKESRDDFSLQAFREMVRYIDKRTPSDAIRRITVLPLGEKIKLYNELILNTTANGKQICKFLHIKA